VCDGGYLAKVFISNGNDAFYISFASFNCQAPSPQRSQSAPRFLEEGFSVIAVYSVVTCTGVRRKCKSFQ